MATHSSILAWEIPWTEEPSGLKSTGSQRVGHEWMTEYIHRKPSVSTSKDSCCRKIHDQVTQPLCKHSVNCSAADTVGAGDG